jgi:hypothetical protein
MADKDLELAKIAWENLSWIDQADRVSFEEYYKSGAWKMHIAEKNNTRKAGVELTQGLIGLIVVFAIIYFVVTGIEKGASGVSGFFGDKADHKANCQTNYAVTAAKTEFAAKQAYKKCMDR